MANVTLVLVLCNRVAGCDPCDILLLEINNPTKLIMFPDGRQQTFVESKIQSIVALAGGQFEYTVTYDDAVLVDPMDPLLACDVETVCCENCRTRFLRNLLGGVVASDLSLDGMGTVADPLSINISSDATNQIVLGGDGGIFAGTAISDATSVRGSGGATNFPVADITALGDVRAANTSIIINNPSATRTLNFLYNFQGRWSLRLVDNGEWQMDMYVDAVLTSSQLVSTLFGAGSQRNEDFEQNVFVEGNIAASGMLTDTLEVGVRTIDASDPSSFFNEGSLSFAFLGVTE